MNSFARSKKLIEEIENNFDVSQLNWQGINFWPLVRRDIQKNFSYERTNNSEFFTPARTHWMALPFICLKLAFYSIVNHFTRYRINADIVVNGYTSALYTINFEGKYFNQYIDPYYEELKKKFNAAKIVLKEDIENFKGEMYHPCQILDTSGLTKYFFLKDLIRTKSSKKEYEKIKGLVERINAYTRKNFDVVVINNETYSHIQTVYRYYRIYSFVWKGSNARLFISEGAYDNHTFGAVAACKDFDIQVVEIQHGVIEDAVYSPYRGNSTFAILPQYIWVWCRRDAEFIEKQNTGGFLYYRPLQLGNLWVSRCLQSGPMPEPIINKLRANHKKIFVLTLQPTFMPGTELINFMKGNPDLFFVVKAHPNNSPEEIASLKQKFGDAKHIDFDLALNYRLVSLFKVADFHITHSSASAVEAISVGLPTIIYNEYGLEIFKDYVQKGLMFFCSTENEMLQLVKQSVVVNRDELKNYSSLPDPGRISETFEDLLSKCAA